MTGNGIQRISPQDLALEATIQAERVLKASTARWAVSPRSDRSAEHRTAKSSTRSRLIRNLIKELGSCVG